MIFLTTGTQLPFNRLTKAMDDWCAANQSEEVFGQIACKNPDDYKPQNYTWTDFLNPADYQMKFDAADIIVAHAGMGSIISALTAGKPILIMPRIAKLLEHRNEHQLATAAELKSRNGVYVAESEESFSSALNNLIENRDSKSGGALQEFAEEALVTSIREFIFQD